MIETVLKGNHYSREVRGMDIIAEALQRILLRELVTILYTRNSNHSSSNLKPLEKVSMEKGHVNEREEVEDTHHLLQDFNAVFFVKTGKKRSKVFYYRITFLHELFLILKTL